MASATVAIVVRVPSAIAIAAIVVRARSATATAVFDGSDDVTIGLDVDPDELDDAHEALERLFHNCNCYIPHTL